MKYKEFVLNIVDGSEKIFYMNIFLYLLRYDNDYESKINEWILQMKHIIKEINQNDIQSFWKVNNVINKCIWLSNKDKKLLFLTK